MRKPLPTRRLVGGVPCALLAAFVLLARLLAPSMAMPQAVASADAVARAALGTICHAGPTHAGPTHHGTDGRDQAPVPGHDGCQLCPACHLVGQLALPAPEAGLAPAPVLALTGLAVPLPPATGPPSRPRPASPPTGPPFPSA